MRRALAKEKPIAQLCREYGISRKTGHKWINRYREQGAPGLVDDSRHTNRPPIGVSAEMVVAIIRLRQEHPTWGPKHLWRVLARTAEDRQAVPTPATIGRILHRAGLVTHRWPTRRDPGDARSIVVRQPNDLWTAGFEGGWRAWAGNRSRFELLTVRDAFSRYVLALQVLSSASHVQVRAVFEDLFTKYGLPKAILTDDDMPFVSPTSLGGLTRLSAWWVSLGVVLARASGASQVERPPEAVNLNATPSAELYRPSERKLPTRPVVVGSFPEGCDLRKVSDLGVFTYARQRIYASKALAGFHIGVQPAAGREVWVWFHDVVIGKFVPGVDQSVRSFDLSNPCVSFDTAQESST